MYTLLRTKNPTADGSGWGLCFLMIWDQAMPDFSDSLETDSTMVWITGSSSTAATVGALASLAAAGGIGASTIGRELRSG